MTDTVDITHTDTAPPEPDARRARRRFLVALACITAAGFVLRLAYLWFERRGSCSADLWKFGCSGDAWVYHEQANLLADGKGFISPIAWIYEGVRSQTAYHPPLFFSLLAGFSLVGLESWFAHQFVVVLVGTCSVLVAGLATREMFGSRVALVTAALVALNPNVWINDGNVLAESLSILLFFAMVWAAYRLWNRPSIGRAVVLGVVFGLSMLTRTETAMLVALVGFPITLLARRDSWRDRLTRLGALIVAALVVVAPWVGYNLSRFHRPVTLSANFGATLASTNCDLVYYGSHIGGWNLNCIPVLPDPPDDDESDADIVLRDIAIDYIRAHERRLPVVFAARVGRMWNFYAPLQQVQLDRSDGRVVWASQFALVVFYPLLLLAIAGAVVTRRRRIPLSPLLGPIVMSTLSAMITFGQSRYRALADAAMCVLVAVAIDAIVRAVAARRASDTSGDGTRVTAEA